MTELIDILKVDKIAQNKYEDLKNSELIDLPRDIDSFLNYLENLDYKDDCLNKINRYHAFNEIFQKLRIIAAVKYFQQNILDLDMPVEKISTVYERLAEDWISDSEVAQYEIEEFIDFVNLLK